MNSLRALSIAIGMEESYHTPKVRPFEIALYGIQTKKQNTNGILAHIGALAPTSMENYALQADAHVANTTHLFDHQ